MFIPSITLHVRGARIAPTHLAEREVEAAGDAVLAAIYCRTSTVKQKVDSQLSACVEHCEKRGYAVSRQYIEEGHSGDAPYIGPRIGTFSCDSWVRPLFKQLLLETVLFRPFDVVVCWSDDRWSRLPPSVDRQYKRLLEEHRVRLEFVVDCLEHYNPLA